MKIPTIFKLIIGLSLWAPITTSCTNQDVLFAGDLVPNSQTMSTVIDSSLTVQTSIMKIDSIATSTTQGVTYLGSVWNPIVGKTTSQVISNYIPKTFELNDQEFLFGKDAVFDSMFMILVFNNYKGDTTHKMHISVHELKDTTLRFWQTYYSDFNAENFYDPTPIVEFDISGGAQNHKQLLPRQYFDKLYFNIKDEKTNPYYSDSVFIEKFKGFYFKVREVNPPTQGSIYRLNLASSGMQLHYHNSEPEPDTTYHPFFFSLKDSKTVSFYTVDNDFSLADPSRGGVDAQQINDSTIQVSTCYVSAMAGLGTRVVIDTAYINDLRQKTIEAGYSKMAVHRAHIRWYFSDATPDTYSWAPPRLGLYFDFNASNTVPDYDPVREAYAASMGQSFQSDLGGYINRSNGYYEQVITSTIQRLINRNPDVSNVVQLLPSATDISSYGYASLGGSLSLTKQPSMVIVYTMIR